MAGSNYRVWRVRIILLVIAVGFLGGCGRPPRETATLGINVPFVPQVSINEIMVGQVDHAAHAILELSLAEGHQPSLGEWQELEHFAIQLVSSTSAITMGGSGANDAMWVAQQGWRSFTGMMNDASSQALRAARSQDLPAIITAGDQLRAACDGCHQQYKPEFPTQGFYRIH